MQEGAALSSVEFWKKRQFFTPICTVQIVGFDEAIIMTDM